MTTETVSAPEIRAFEADVSKLLHMMVHSVYSDRDVFLRELISNAADACEKLRYEAISSPELFGDDPQARITVSLDQEAGMLTITDNGIGMTAADMAETLGTIARSGTKAFMDRLSADRNGEGQQLIGQFGVGFYSAFMVAGNVEVVSRRAGEAEAASWSSDGSGTYTIAPVDPAHAPARGTRVTLSLLDEAKSYAERQTVERIVRAQSGHVPVPIFLEDAGSEDEARQLADGVALWTKPKSDISENDYADFYRSVAGQFDKPALTLHYRAEGRHEYSVLTFIPENKPFDLFDPARSGRIKLYVRRVFITDEAEILPRYLRFVRGLVDSADLPLNMSREMIQESPVLSAIQKGVSNRILSELDKLAANEADRYAAIWENFGAVLKEGLYEDYERRDQLLTLARFKTTASSGEWRSLKDYVEGLKENQTAIYYATGDDLDRIATSPHLEGFKARGIEVLLLPDQVDNFWTTMGVDYDGKPFRSVTQGAAELSLIPLAEGSTDNMVPAEDVSRFVAFAREVLADQVSDVRISDRLTTSAVCIVAPDNAMDLQLEKMLASAGHAPERAKPVLEVNARHALIAELEQSTASEDERRDIAFLLLDEARISEGEAPADPRAFVERLERLMAKSLV
ncbi:MULTISPECIES: molecular chaperone HtpG [unclassified Novosphingobium]|uniref:molecular chaperone HtpG n=1 Tax=unclassified Novosphingobium TaxID=2644732 RepID=UPI00135BC8A9|nr:MULTISPECIES: molecular chaperone HtpG [unclassified Novosphingobium]